MKDEILLQLGFISDEMMEEISGFSPKTRESHRKHRVLPYILYGKKYIYPITKLKEDLQAKVEKRYGTPPEAIL